MSHYETLGVPKDADAATIKKAFRRKASKAHTDRGGGDHSQMVAINRAYDTLSDPEKRERYDRTGDDGRTASPDAQAMEVAMQIVMAMMEQAPDHEDVILLARRSIERNIADIDTKQKNAERQAKVLAKKRTRLTHKGKKAARNFLDDLIAQKIGQLEQSIAHMQEGVTVFTRAIELLEDYSYKAEKAPQAQWAPAYQATDWVIFGSGAGTR